MDSLVVVLISLIAVAIGFALGVVYRKLKSEKSIVSAEKEAEKIKIEEIQDMIEDALIKGKYEDVFKSFSEKKLLKLVRKKLF